MVHACSEAYPGHPPSNMSSSVVKDACPVAKEHVLPASRCEGKQTTTTTAAVEPMRPLLLANQRSLSDKLDLSLVSAGNYRLRYSVIHVTSLLIFLAYCWPTVSKENPAPPLVFASVYFALVELLRTLRTDGTRLLGAM